MAHRDSSSLVWVGRCCGDRRARRQRRVASSPASRGVAVSPRAVVQAQQLPPSRVSRPPGLLESACGRGPQKGRTQSFAVPSCCRPVARERSRTEASSFFLDPSRGRQSPGGPGLQASNVLGQIQILIYLQACIPGVCILGVGPYLVGGPGRPPRLPASRAGPEYVGTNCLYE